MHEGRKVYPLIKQKDIVKDAIDIILKRYGSYPEVQGIYLGGSAANWTLGEYDEPIGHKGAERIGSDIDVLLVVKDDGPLLISKAEEKKYMVRHVGETDQIPVYREVDGKREDVLLEGKHPIEHMIVTKHLFEGFLSGKYPWGAEGSKPFSERMKECAVLKETTELRDIRTKYTE